MRHALDRWLSTQAAHPRGILAPLIGRWLEYENRVLNSAAVRALALQPGERLLEVGCGPGWALAQLASSGADQLAAVDTSPAMVRRASRRTGRLRALARAGKLDVRCAPAESLPFPTGTFDAALAVNAVYFWQPPLAGLKELSRVLRPGGRLVLAVETPETLAAAGATAATGFTVLAASALSSLCEVAGFHALTLETVSGRGAYCIRATVSPV